MLDRYLRWRANEGKSLSKVGGWGFAKWKRGNGRSDSIVDLG